MSAPLDGVVSVERNGKVYQASYRAIGGTAYIETSIGPTESVDVAQYDKRLDEIARDVLNEHIDKYANKPKT